MVGIRFEDIFFNDGGDAVEASLSYEINQVLRNPPRRDDRYRFPKKLERLCAWLINDVV
jgi:hypothetical protein